MTSWFVLFSIIFCLNSDFLFRNFLSIPSDTKIKRSFGANSREENKFLNLDYLAGPNTWINRCRISISTFSDAHWIIRFSVRHKYKKKKQAHQFWWHLRVTSFLVLEKLLTRELHTFLSSETYWIWNLVFNSFFKIRIYIKLLLAFHWSLFQLLSFLTTRIFLFLNFWYFNFAFAVAFVKAIWYFVSSLFTNFYSFDSFVLRCFNCEKFINRKDEVVRVLVL